MSKHTPGPWSVGKDLTDPSKLLTITDSTGFTLAWAGEMENQEKQANALLIAAAPEMLEALNDCLQAINNILDVDPDTFIDVDGYDAREYSFYKLALNAIKKAEGETP